MDVPDDVAGSLESGAALRFHGGDMAERTLARYEARRRDVAARLDEIDRLRAVTAAPTRS